MINTYLSLEYIAIVLFGLIMVLFSIGSVYLNIERDEKKKEPYKSRRQKVKEYNRAERRNNES
jgi:NADH:ubiquinone oxidoreductase subunit 3 (subunit A)